MTFLGHNGPLRSVNEDMFIPSDWYNNYIIFVAFMYISGRLMHIYWWIDICRSKRIHLKPKPHGDLISLKASADVSAQKRYIL
jgi:hypothetical protein